MLRKYQLWPKIVETKGKKLFWNQTSYEIKLRFWKDRNEANSLETLKFHRDVTHKWGSDLCYTCMADRHVCWSLRSSHGTFRAKQSQKISVLSEVIQGVTEEIRLKGISGIHLVQTPAQAGWPRASCSVLCPIGVSPRVEPP